MYFLLGDANDDIHTRHVRPGTCSAPRASHSLRKSPTSRFKNERADWLANLGQVRGPCLEISRRQDGWKQRHRRCGKDCDAWSSHSAMFAQAPDVRKAPQENREQPLEIHVHMFCVCKCSHPQASATSQSSWCAHLDGLEEEGCEHVPRCAPPLPD